MSMFIQGNSAFIQVQFENWKRVNIRNPIPVGISNHVQDFNNSRGTYFNGQGTYYSGQGTYCNSQGTNYYSQGTNCFGQGVNYYSQGTNCFGQGVNCYGQGTYCNGQGTNHNPLECNKNLREQNINKSKEKSNIYGTENFVNQGNVNEAQKDENSIEIEVRYKATKKTKKDVNGSIKVIILSPGKCIIIVDKDKPYKIAYDDDNIRDPKKKAGDGKMFLGIDIENVLKNCSNITYMEIEQINEYDESDRIKGEVELKEKERIDNLKVRLNTNKYKEYKTRITFYSDKREKILEFYFIMECMKTVRRKNKGLDKNQIRINLIKDIAIEDLIKLFKNSKKISKIFFELIKKEMKNETMIAKIKKFDNKKKILSICQLSKENPRSKVLLCFEYLYSCIIGDNNTSHVLDESMIRCFCQDHTELLKNFNLGLSGTNDIIIFSNESSNVCIGNKRDHEEDPRETGGKRSKTDNVKKDSIQQTLKNSEYESFIS